MRGPWRCPSTWPGQCTPAPLPPPPLPLATLGLITCSSDQHQQAPRPESQIDSITHLPVVALQKKLDVLEGAQPGPS
jgi:hypothetical protein